MSSHPNATAAVGAGAVATLLIYVAGLFGLDMSAEVGAAAGSIIIAGFLLLGRDGLKGLAARIWRGSR